MKGGGEKEGGGWNAGGQYFVCAQASELADHLPIT